MDRECNELLSKRHRWDHFLFFLCWQNILTGRPIGSYGCTLKVIIEWEEDLAQPVTTCNIDLFQRHITLRFPLVRLNEQIIDLMSAHQRAGPLPNPAMIWRTHFLLNPPWHLPLRCRPHVEHRLPACGAAHLGPVHGPWLLRATWWQCWAAKCSSCVCVWKCVRARARVIATDSCREGGNSASDMVQNRVSVRVSFWWIRIRHHNVDHGTTFRRCLHATSHKIKPMHMHRRMRTVNQTQCCFMLVFHKLTVPLQAPFRPRAPTQTVENPPVSVPLLHFACGCLLVCQDFCVCVCFLTLLWWKKMTCFASYSSKRGHTDSTPTRRLQVKAKFEFSTA